MNTFPFANAADLNDYAVINRISGLRVGMFPGACPKSAIANYLRSEGTTSRSSAVNSDLTQRTLVSAYTLTIGPPSRANRPPHPSPYTSKGWRA